MHLIKWHWGDMDWIVLICDSRIYGVVPSWHTQGKKGYFHPDPINCHVCLSIHKCYLKNSIYSWTYCDKFTLEPWPFYEPQIKPFLQCEYQVIPSYGGEKHLNDSWKQSSYIFDFKLLLCSICNMFSFG
jgi:hypothetical protein